MRDTVTSPQDLESFDTFVAIIARLRGPDGCPWDLKQTHASLKRYLREECAEVLDAIDGGDPDALAEELGDVLLQVGLHAQIGADEGTFTLADVLKHVNGKLVRRHPHVFGDVEVSGAEEVAANWRKLKQAEHGERESVLDGVPKALPALAYSQEIHTRAARTGFDWPDMAGVLDKVQEELRELDEAKTPVELEHELGDVVATLVNVARKLDIDIEGALRKANRRFEGRFRHMEAAARGLGTGIEELPLARQEELWQDAKRAEREAKD
jgi:tetrapyrrole methylase family protein/MazG family protein